MGNAAGVGARLALVSKEQRELAKDIARRVKYVELLNYKRYPHTFAFALRFPSAESLWHSAVAKRIISIERTQDYGEN